VSLRKHFAAEKLSVRNPTYCIKLFRTLTDRCSPCRSIRLSCPGIFNAQVAVDFLVGAFKPPDCGVFSKYAHFADCKVFTSTPDSLTQGSNTLDC
jgi:hypothetical protein